MQASYDGPGVLKVAIIDEPRVFEPDELFFSTTDNQGRIRTANEVFLRISGFAAEELKNKPHSIIRHPDMPRVVFQLLWDEIRAGRQILAHVKNRAKDGRYYWVAALVTPIEDGYLSVRFKPSSDLFIVVQNLYRELRQVESRVEAAHQGKPAAIEAGRKVLDAALLSLGFADYRAFMYEVFHHEIRSRETALKKRSRSRQGTPECGGPRVMGGASRGEARRVAESCQAALTAFDRLFDELAVYSGLNDGIRSKSEFVTSLSESVRMLSLNGAIEAERLGMTGSGLGKVLDWLQLYSRDIAQGCEELTSLLERLIIEIKSVVFELSSAKLQIEMTTNFAIELLRQDDGARDAVTNVGMQAGAMQNLYTCSSGTVGRALSALGGVGGKLHALDQAQQSLWKTIRSLRLIYLRGKLEMASVGSDRLSVIFEDMNRYVTETESSLGALECLIEELKQELVRSVGHSPRIAQAIARIDPVELQCQEEEVCTI